MILYILEIWSYLQLPVVWYLFKRFAKRNVAGDMLAGVIIGIFLEFATEPLWIYHFKFTIYRDIPPGILFGWCVMFTMVVFISEKLYCAVFKTSAIAEHDKRIFLFDLIGGILGGMPFEIIGAKLGVWDYNWDVLNWNWGNVPLLNMPAEVLASYALLMLIAPTFVRYWQGSFEKP